MKRPVFDFYFCLYEVVNNINVFSIAMGEQQLVSFAPLSNCEMFRTAVNSKR